MLKDISLFLAHPKPNDSPFSMNLKQSILLLIKMVLLYFGLTILLSLITQPLLKYWDLFPEKSLRASQIPLTFKLFILTPIYEELIFRLPLKFPKRNLFVSFSVLAFMLFYHKTNLFVLSTISLIIVLIPYMQLLPAIIYSKMELLWKNYLPVVYYGQAIIFGLVHLTNFHNLNLAHYLLFPLIVSNQIIMGLLFGYVRISFRGGIFYSVMLHFLINLPLILISKL